MHSAMGTFVPSSASRIHREPPDRLRDPFDLDRHRIVTSTAFRRLEGKTQVFGPSHHDHFRTRLTHTLEAAQVARTLAHAVGADAALAEAVTLAHDLGHPPFGHAGESALNACMADHGGFDHNAHSVRVVEYLEHPYPAFRGLNLTLATLAGLSAHCTRYDRPAGDAAEFRRDHDAVASDFAVTLAADVASLADRIAYNMADLEDAVGAEFVDEAALSRLALWREAYEPLVRRWPGRSIYALRRGTLDAIVDALIADAAGESDRGRLAAGKGGEPGTGVRFSGETEARLQELEQFLLERVYRHPEVAAMDGEGATMIRELFAVYGSDPRQMPERFAQRLDEQGAERVACDYIAGMTDRYCRREWLKRAAARNSLYRPLS